MINTEKINLLIDKHLQKKVDFCIDNKKIKSGKLLLFSIKDFYCVFLLMSEEKNKRITYEVPYPFNITEDNNNIIFDFTLNTFILNNNSIKNDVALIKNKKTSKLLNKKLVLKFYI